ncbi:MAG: hypothetical protein AseanaTS_12620 [Candidatus Pelagadaptatus aseana]|uniref:substrate-binding periplasmic protein n=1 Tax=Candidatus Pelagadaptatus aseana TaxID=3120508 RepID=UPI0039B35930
MPATQFTFWLILLSLLSVLCTAQPQLQTSTDPVRVATSIIKPWGMVIDGEQQGLLIETAKVLHTETGIPYRHIFRPYTRVFHELLSGYSDLALVFQSPRVDQDAILVGTITQTRVILVGLPDNQPIDSLAQLNGQSVGHMRGSKYGAAFDLATNFKRQPINTIEQGLAMLKRQRIDYMAAVDHTVYWGMKQLGLSATEIAEMTSLQGPILALYMSKKSPHLNLLPVYQQAVARLNHNGTFKAIYGNPQRWLDEIQQQPVFSAAE